MIYSVVTRRVLVKAIGCVALPLAVIGCQHSHVATTQVVVQIGTTQTAIAEVAAPEPVAPPTTQATAITEEPTQATPGPGHGVAEATRQTYHAAAESMRDVGSSTADITMRSAEGLRNTPPESLSTPEIDIDQAMQLRDWDQVTATYRSGGTLAGPTGYLFHSKAGQPQWHYAVTEMPLFFVNTLLLPVALINTPPWAPVEWKGATVEPTYTGVPPLPPE